MPDRLLNVGGRLGVSAAFMLLAALFTSIPTAAAELILASGFVDSGGEQIYFESVGAGETVVLSHGGGGNHAIWYQQVPVLAQEYRVVTWDQRGFGRSSDQNRQSGPATAVEDLRALLDHLDVDRAHLVGQSMGGWAVMGFALKYPERVRSLILADTLAGIMTPEAAEWYDADPPQGVTRPEQLPITRHPALSDALGDRDPEKAFLYRQIGSAAPAGVDTELRQSRLRQTRYAIEEVRSLRMPVLFLVGEHDSTFPPAMIGSIARECTGAQLKELPGAGHSPYFETPDAWNAAVMDFLDRVSQH
jgi:pimeloyl-ACP methyl ester carboxylesterase